MMLKWLVPAAIGLAAAGVHATTVDWGVHGDLEVAAILDDPGAIDDLITFTIPGTSDLASTTVSNNLSTLLGISGGEVSLFSSDATLLSSYAFDGTTGNVWHTTTSLAAGDYYYEITGTAIGSSGGFYSISSTVTPVPEPETLALFLAGLGVIGWVSRRRAG